MNTINKITPEIARIHAHICGDGCIYLKREKRPKKYLLNHNNIYENVWTIEYSNNSIELLNEFANDFKIAFDRKAQMRPKYNRVRISSAKWIIDMLDLKNKNSYNWHIPELITNQDKNIISAQLRAFFDDEATVTEKGAVRVKSMNWKGLIQISELLLRFGINSSITGPNSDKSYYIYIYKKCSAIYDKSIGFLHPSKKKKLQMLKMNEPAEI